ncbi:hypothetical protein HYX13_01500 [Candidatus Woesearchaeota archaeon]|nr:hypothetical protein [Candidatus Woesearchaeota archaeon]
MTLMNKTATEENKELKGKTLEKTITEPKAIVTVPPYAPFIDEIVEHPLVSGIRLNIVMPLKGSRRDNLKRLQDLAGYKDLWIDLKCRQLRIKTYGVPPFTEVELSHIIGVNTPTTAYFTGGKEGKIPVTVLAVEGNKLIMQDGPHRVVGPGESINIPDSSLKIEGYFTETDLQYITAAKEIGLHRYMLSFVEKKEDIDALRGFDKNAKIIAKIESQKGLGYVAKEWNKNQETRLMAARGDLYMEVKKPHEILDAVEGIVAKDPSAIAASRILDSFADSLEPTCQDISDIDNLLRMGYRTFMLGDEVCLRRESVLSALNLLNAVCERYKGK